MRSLTHASIYLLIFLCSFYSSLVSAEVSIVGSYDRGYFAANGFAGNGYFVGSVKDFYGPNQPSELRNWFVFNTNLIRTATAATLNIYLPPQAGSLQNCPNHEDGYASQDVTERITIRHVSTDPALLTIGFGGIGTFNDLGTGTIYREANIFPSDMGSVIAIPLNQDAIESLNLHEPLWAVGGSISTLSGSSGDNEGLFRGSVGCGVQPYINDSIIGNGADGIVAYLEIVEEPDFDNDGIADASDNCLIAPNLSQNDIDNDGTGDECDLDKDGDGSSNGVDNCPEIANSNQSDLDGDNIGDACDLFPNGDTDNDGIDEILDNCPLISNPSQSDLDFDGVGDACDTTPNGDTDNDSIDNNIDNCPLLANIDQVDTDSDSVGDACDLTPNGDSDNDGIDEFTDNCPTIANPLQLNADNDLFGDLCDPDIDGDSVLNLTEEKFGGNKMDANDAESVLNNIENYVATTPLDIDNDGVPDDYETAAGGDTTSSTFEFVLSMLTVNKQVPAMGGIGLLALGLSMLGLGAVRLRKKINYK
ncbi:MAG: hypothetical protein CBD32_03280 [Actinobacteria bacterium TMED172]|nr:hypothetical protein [Cellvibrionales bacterium]OUW33486.1 MAG: hypothetical protein CBD32_03280 [Actinobacteria bacterium TMED172]